MSQYSSRPQSAGDLALTGFDCIQTLGAEQVFTTVQSRLDELSRLAVKKLQAMVNGTSFERQTILPVRLRIGTKT